MTLALLARASAVLLVSIGYGFLWPVYVSASEETEEFALEKQNNESSSAVAVESSKGDVLPPLYSRRLAIVSSSFEFNAKGAMGLQEINLPVVGQKNEKVSEFYTTRAIF